MAKKGKSKKAGKAKQKKRGRAAKMADKKFIDEALKAHNEYRARHQVAALKHNKDVSAVAQRWADHLAASGTFQHNKDRSYKGDRLGENIAMKWTSGGDDYSGYEVTSQWYEEVHQYDFQRGVAGSSGHFTQVVWKDSRELGIGRARSRDGKWIVVANYLPAGNFIGRFRENVLPSRSGSMATVGMATRPREQPVVHTDRGGTSFFDKLRQDSGHNTPTHQGTWGMQPPSDSRGGWGGGGRTVVRETRTTREGLGLGAGATTVVVETTITSDRPGARRTVTTEQGTSSEWGARPSAGLDGLFKKMTLGGGEKPGAVASREIKAPRGSTIVVTPDTSVTVREPVKSTKGWAPTSSVTVREPVSSGKRWTPTSSVTVREPVSSAKGWTPASSVTVREPFSSAKGWTPTNSVTIEVPVNSTKRWEPASQVTVREPVNSAKRWEPASHVTVREPVNSTGWTPTSSSKSAFTPPDRFGDEVIEAHNRYRRRHGNVGDLRRNKDLDAMAQQWAQRLARSNTLQHSNATYRGQPAGENIATRWSSQATDMTGQEAVDGWYDEIRQFSFAGGGRFSSNTGHFTQLVWKGSREVGVGKAHSTDKRTVFVVCNYFPPGNVTGRFKENVFPVH